MSTRMLIDARHAEETRVTVVKGNRVEEFDYETAGKVQLKGNVYLAKITRVEPSLQAAFVDYGGNRHGFLAFSEIHPDYYQIPVEDRDALLAEEAAANADSEKSDDENGDDSAKAKNGKNDEEDSEEEADDAVEDEYQESLRQRRLKRLRRKYRIQEVIKRNQVLLIQVVKEERGTKGAALTTYISIAGRYCVMMPNTTHSGGISRKISNLKDRKRLRNILNDLPIAKGMGCIIRTNGITRTKAEVKRDFDYLLRAWEGIRNRTFESTAPALIYEEGNLVKRAIRDLYDRTIDDVLVEGEAGFNMARDFMRLLMPSHASRVQHYQDRIPLFHRYQVETLLDQMFDPNVVLKSGGYLVINPTEALIAIDVNSGRSTKEHNIEETALKTNLEAAQEVARQLRLRDLAGLVVIDFIDMEVRGNIRAVERKMKEAVKSDRARIQIGRISAFGLMEISRQRLRPNLVETATEACRHCEGTGRIRSLGSSALHVIRGIEEECILARASKLVVSVPQEIGIYLLNQKRTALSELEQLSGTLIEIAISNELVGINFEIERVGETPGPSTAPAEDKAEKHTHRGAKSRNAEPGGKSDQRGGRKSKDKAKAESDPVTPSADTETPGDDQPKKPRRRRRGRRGGRSRRRGGVQGQGVEGVQAEARTDETAASESKPDTAEAKTAPGDDKPAEAKRPEEAKKPAQRRRSPAKKADTETSGDPKQVAAVADTNKAEKPAKKAPSKRPSRAAAKESAPKAEKPAEKPAEKSTDKDKPKPKKAPAKASAKSKESADKPATDASKAKTASKSASKPVKEKKAAAPRKPRATKAKAEDKTSKPEKAKPERVKPEVEAKTEPKAKKETKPAVTEKKTESSAPVKKKLGWWSRGLGG